MKRKTFAIVVVLVVLVIAGSWAGGRLSLQELLTIAALILLWAFGVSLWRVIKRMRSKLTPPPDPRDG